MIATPQALEALIARALEAECVALDTEFVWERTYYPQLGLVQVGFAEDDSALIDTVACRDLAPLGRLLAAPEVVKILHDAPQDLTILRRITGSSPKNIFDTRRAAGFVGLSATLSLGDLLREILGVALPKTETRTNWLRRPLSAEQHAYAHSDVRYLPAARAELLARLRQRHRETWFYEEMNAYDDPALYAEK
ncbi:MAG: ribonuclease D, partial [Rhodothermales bacterium]